MTEQKLNELNIFALREIARMVGVVSPTSKKKSTLIAEILEIKQGIKQPNIIKSKQGRPPKGILTNLDSFANENVGLNFSKNIVLKQDNFYEDLELKTIEGFVQFVNENVAFLWVEHNFSFKSFFIPLSVINKFNLQMGDKVTAEVVKENQQLIVADVFSINNFPISKLPARTNYLTIPHQAVNKNLDFANNFNTLNIECGQNVYYYDSQNVQSTNNIINLLNNCKADVKIYINLSLTEKSKIYLSSLTDSNLFVSNLTDDVDIARKTVELATEYAKRMFELGRNVVIAIDDILTLISIDKENAQLTKNIISLAKTNAGSITTVSILPEHKEINIIEKLADKRIKFVDNQFINI